jgi:hypothetical protein
VLVASLVAQLGGCARVGFGDADGAVVNGDHKVVGDANGDRQLDWLPADSLPSDMLARDTDPTAIAAGPADDGCPVATTIDLSGTNIKLSINPTQFTSTCNTAPLAPAGAIEVVLGVSKAPGSVGFICQGGGTLYYASASAGSSCADACSGQRLSNGSLTCSGSNFSTITFAEPTSTLILFRKPQAGPVLVIFHPTS